MTTTVEDPGLEPFPEPRRGVRRAVVVLAVLAFAAVVAVVGAFLWYRRQADPPGGPGEEVAVTVPLGSSTARIASLLDDHGVISSASLWRRVYLRLEDAGPFQAGAYTFRRNSSFDEATAVLEAGPEVEFEALTVPEGLRLEEIAERVGTLEGRSAERFLAALRSGAVRSRYQPPEVTSLEGLLLPETYHTEPDETEEDLARRMVEAMDAELDRLDVTAAAQRLGVTPYQVVVVASLVEREARRDVDRGPVAGVIYNRLRRGMLLQIDATLLYARGEHRERVLDADKDVDSPYNTYRHKGLPPTPIAAPGRAVLEAAVAPATHDQLFYVTVNDCTGETVFARTNAEHERNVARRRRENPAQC